MPRWHAPACNGRTRPVGRGREELNWFWLRSRRVASAGGLAHGSAGRLAWGKAVRRIWYACLGVVLAGAAAGCTGSPGSTGQGPDTTAGSPSLFMSRTAPDAPVGRQLTWFLRAMADIPWSQQVIRAHFDSGFLGSISPAQLNSNLDNLPAVAASLNGLLWQNPARDPDSLLAVASFGGQQLTVEIVADRAGLISYLVLNPYQPRRPPGPRPTGTSRRWLLMPAC